MKLFPRLFPVLAVCLLLSACTDPETAARNARLATEVAEISASISSTRSVLPSEMPAEPELPLLPDTPEPPSEVLPTATDLPVFDPPTATPLPTETPEPTAEETATPQPTAKLTGHFVTRTPEGGMPTADMRPYAASWRDWPVLPVISDTAVDIFRYGVQELGTDPHRLSVIGDCHSEPNVFLGVYDTDYYDLSEKNAYLTTAIDWFRGSFAGPSYAVHAGMSAASVLSQTWADPNVCQPGESSLDCEIRLHNPSIMFVNLGTNWVQGLEMDVYYNYLAEIVRTLIDHGILPILSSKADNAEGNHDINRTTAQVARDFNVPYFNFWTIAQTLPNNGLDPAKDGVHLSVEAWNWRNFYALKTIYTIGQRLGLF